MPRNFDAKVAKAKVTASDVPMASVDATMVRPNSAQSKPANREPAHAPIMTWPTSVMSNGTRPVASPVP